MRRFLGRALHVSRPTVSMWEHGTRGVARHYWSALGAALGLTDDEVAALFTAQMPARLDGTRLPSLGRVRRAAGVSQHALAASVGVAPTTVSMWETAGVRVPLPIAPELARVLDTEVDRLASEPPAPGPETRPLRGYRRAAGMSWREAAAHLGIAVATLARYEAGQLCGSGLQAVWSAAMQIRWGAARICAGPWGRVHVADTVLRLRARAGYRLGDRALVDGMVAMLTDPFHGVRMA
jgi:transcriptional regulator with XRE-family HTH domain